MQEKKGVTSVPELLGGSSDWSNLLPLYLKRNRSRSARITPFATLLIGKLAEATRDARTYMSVS